MKILELSVKEIKKMFTNFIAQSIGNQFEGYF
jgi:hypothetical protein